MATDSDASRPDSAIHSFRDGASSYTESESESQSATDSLAKVAGKSSILLAEDPFASGESKLLFEAIDQLRSHGAGQVLKLPQVLYWP